MAAQTQCGERERRSTASASLTSPVLTALRRAKSSSSCTCVTCTSCKKYCEKAMAWSATSTSQPSIVLGSTSNTRATARMPSPAASAPTAHTSRSGATRVPCNGVPWVSWKYPSQRVQYSCRQGPPLGWPLARRLPQPTQPRYVQSELGQKWVEVSTWRRRPRVGTRRGGGVEGACGHGAVPCSQVSQGGLVVKPAKGLCSRWRFGFGGVGSDGGGHVAGSLGHAHWSMTHSHTRATSTS